MPLTFSKLHKFLLKHGLVYRTVFTRQGDCTHVEVVSELNGEIFLIYIPSKYEIHVESMGKDFYEVDYIDVSEEGVIAEDFAQQISPLEVQRAYEGVLNDALNSGDDLLATLEENYRHTTILPECVKQDMQSLRNTFRQLRRLRLCVQNLSYKVSIIYRNYVCSIRRDDTLEGFTISDFPGTNRYRLLITIDLESMYEKMSSVLDDVQTVREAVYMIMSKNQTRHASNLDTLLIQQRSIKESSDIIYEKKIDLEQTLRELSHMLTTLAEAEKQRYIERKRISDDAEDNAVGIHHDIEKGRRISLIDSELKNLDQLKQDIITNIISHRSRLENLTVRIDSVFFDNSVMLDEISKNFASLEEAV